MDLGHCLLFEYHIDAISKYTIRAERGVGCFVVIVIDIVVVMFFFLFFR